MLSRLDALLKDTWCAGVSGLKDTGITVKRTDEASKILARVWSGAFSSNWRNFPISKSCLNGGIIITLENKEMQRNKDRRKVTLRLYQVSFLGKTKFLFKNIARKSKQKKKTPNLSKKTHSFSIFLLFANDALNQNRNYSDHLKNYSSPCRQQVGRTEQQMPQLRCGILQSLWIIWKQAKDN